MNAHFQRKNAQRLHQLAHTARAVVARILATLVLLPLLAACVTSGAAQQTVVKAVAREKPIGEIPTPAPAAAPALIAAPAPTSAPASTSTPAPTATPAPTGKPVLIGTNGGEWQFDTVALEIAAGEQIALTFHNGAKTTPHNWLLISGDDMRRSRSTQPARRPADQQNIYPTTRGSSRAPPGWSKADKARP